MKSRIFKQLSLAKLPAGSGSALFLGLWLFSIFVSVFDGFLALRYRETLLHGELNPVGQLLIALNGGDVWLLLAAKFAGTVVAASLVLIIRSSYPRWSLPIMSVVAGSQLSLLLFLLLA